jgi:high-affinity iron transporter
MRRTPVACALALLTAALAATAGDDTEQGRRVFQIYCASCHGPEGAGDGPAAAELDPAPRNLKRDAYRFGETRADLYAVITNGAGARGGSSRMQPYGALLSEQDRRALVGFVWSLKPRED